MFLARSPYVGHMMQVTIKPGREKSILRKHPWIFSGGIQQVQGNPGLGDTVDVVASDGRWLAKGAFSPESQIRVRIWTFKSGENVDVPFFRKRIRNAIAYRRQFRVFQREEAERLVNAESDGLPGLIVDRYGDWIVCQFLTAGVEFWRETIVAVLDEAIHPKGIYERSDADIRFKEGLEQRQGTLKGSVPEDCIQILEGESKYLVDIKNGHKTGFYLDQRENRDLASRLAAGKQILNCFSYTGGFTLAALKGGAAHVTQVELSAEALELARQNMQLNQTGEEMVETFREDVFRVLRLFRDSRRKFDLIILDPPKFVESRKHIEKGCRGYKDINLLAMKLLRLGGILFTFSCSGLITDDLFLSVTASAAEDAGRHVRIVRWLSQAQDHPAALNFPEGKYLKGLLCHVDE